jgi:glycerophosphoryl diester phosphodiesterase
MTLDEDYRPTDVGAVVSGEVAPSECARDSWKAGLDIITWTFERADMRAAPWMCSRQVRILGILPDWQATATHYANCMGLK